MTRDPRNPWAALLFLQGFLNPYGGTFCDCQMLAQGPIARELQDDFIFAGWERELRGCGFGIQLAVHRYLSSARDGVHFNANSVSSVAPKHTRKDIAVRFLGLL